MPSTANVSAEWRACAGFSAALVPALVPAPVPALLPGPAAGDVEFEREAQQAADEHDRSEHRDALDRRCDRDGSDDVCSDQQFETEQHRAAEEAAIRLAAIRLSAQEPTDGDDRADERPDNHGCDTRGIDDRADVSMISWNSMVCSCANWRVADNCRTSHIESTSRATCQVPGEGLHSARQQPSRSIRCRGVFVLHLARWNNRRGSA